MDIIQVKDKKFKKKYSYETIQTAITEVATKINKDLKGTNPLFLCVLNGSFMFAADLLKQIDIPCEISFVKVASYHGTKSSGKVKTMIGLEENVFNREIVIVEDIVDTGETIVDIVNQLKQFSPEDIKIATLLLKPDAYKKDIFIDYAAMKIPNDFIIGYGLDYDGYGRNYKDIYSLYNN